MTAVGFAVGCRDLLRRTGDTVFVVRECTVSPYAQIRPCIRDLVTLA